MDCPDWYLTQATDIESNHFASFKKKISAELGNQILSEQELKSYHWTYIFEAFKNY